MNNLKNLLRAASFAANKHTGQTRKGDDAQPYINHPLEVANLLANTGKVEDFDVLIAAVLHDTVEDTETTKEEITELFGETSVVIAVAAPHRRAAFEACEWLIKELKRTVPIWKKEVYADGETWIEGDAQVKNENLPTEN